MKTAIAAAFRSLHPDFVPFGNFVEECTESVRPFDEPKTEWPVYGVNNQTGVFFSHHQGGGEFNSPYKRIRKDWFFHNPTRANVGSIGRVGNVEENAITSPEYQVWRIKHPEWLPEFVEILIQMPFFNQMVQVHRVGAVKERLYVQNLLEIPVPACTLEKQKRIIKSWQIATANADKATTEGDSTESDALMQFLEALGRVISVSAEPPKTFALRWSAIDRWSTNYCRRTSFGSEGSHWKYPSLRLADLCKGMSGGTPLKASQHFWDGEIPWISPKDMKRFYLSDAEDHISESALKETAAPLIEKGSILIVMRSGILQHTVPVGLTEKPASINQDLRAFTPIDSRIDAEYLGYFLKANQKPLLALVKSSTTVQSMNKDELEDFKIPLPPLQIQQDITLKLKTELENAAKLRAQANNLRTAAKRDIEAALLGQVNNRESLSELLSTGLASTLADPADAIF